MTTVFVILGILLYMGPCTLVYLVARRSGYEQGFRAGCEATRRSNEIGRDYTPGFTVRNERHEDWGA